MHLEEIKKNKQTNKQTKKKKKQEVITNAITEISKALEGTKSKISETEKELI